MIKEGWGIIIFLYVFVALPLTLLLGYQIGQQVLLPWKELASQLHLGQALFYNETTRCLGGAGLLWATTIGLMTPKYLYDKRVQSKSSPA